MTGENVICMDCGRNLREVKICYFGDYDLCPDCIGQRLHNEVGQRDTISRRNKQIARMREEKKQLRAKIETAEEMLLIRLGAGDASVKAIYETLTNAPQ